MPSPTRFLRPAEPPLPFSVDADLVVILASLLCALICVLGLALVARCAWPRPSSNSALLLQPPPNKGLKKKLLRSLPALSFDSTSANAAGRGRLIECPICLAEFADGEQVRVLPHCGHGFHVACVDVWLRFQSSCPSCRRILVVGAPTPACHDCGTGPASTSSAPAGSESEAREDSEPSRL